MKVFYFGVFVKVFGWFGGIFVKVDLGLIIFDLG